MERMRRMTAGGRSAVVAIGIGVALVVVVSACGSGRSSQADARTAAQRSATQAAEVVRTAERSWPAARACGAAGGTRSTCDGLARISDDAVDVRQRVRLAADRYAAHSPACAAAATAALDALGPWSDQLIEWENQRADQLPAEGSLRPVRDVFDALTVACAA